MTTALDQSWLDAADASVELDQDKSYRFAAAKAFKRLGLPHRRMEDWKYTDLRTRLGEALPLAETLTNVEPVPSKLSELADVEICFSNGLEAGVRGDLPQGVELVMWSNAPAFDVNEKPFPEDAFKSETNSMLLLNKTMSRDGFALEIGPEANGKTILLTFDGNDGRQILSSAISVLGAEVTIIEHHLGGPAPQQFQHVMQVRVWPNSKLTHIRVQDSGAKTVHLATDMVSVDRDGVYKGFVLTTGAELARQETFIEFTGPGADAHISGAYLLCGEQHADVTTRIHHAVPHCTSREVFKGVITDSARGVFQGKVMVAKDAQKTDAHQLNKTLLLSPKAEIDTKPELEIFADDVKCSHGAASGQIDEGQMFYLRARGIPEDEARGLLIGSFMSEALDEVEDDAIREILSAHVATWLAANTGIQVAPAEVEAS